MTAESRTVAFRRAVRVWQSGPAKASAPPALIGHAVAALLEQEAAADRVKAAAAARCRAALSALDRGDAAEAAAILRRVVDDAR